jgi:hypothetical protein
MQSEKHENGKLCEKHEVRMGFLVFIAAPPKCENRE